MLIIFLSESRSVMSDSLQPRGLYSPQNSPGQNTGVGRLSLLRGIFPTQGSNPSHQHCRWILYQLSHKGSPRILEWVAYPFSSGYSRPRSQTGVSGISGRFFTNWAIREAPNVFSSHCIWGWCWNREGPYGPCLSCPLHSFCLWKNFGQRVSLIREMRTGRNREKQAKGTT